MFTRANRALGANWTLHDLRHTAAYRMEISDVAATASFDMVRDQGPIRDLGFSAVSSAG
jgi:integrase